MDSHTRDALEASHKMSLEAPKLARALRDRPALLLKAQDAFVLLQEIHKALLPLN